MTQQTRPPQVVIVGGGFGGLYAARALRDAPCDVTLVDRTPQHVFQPLLYQCATGILSEGQITAPLRRLFRKHHNLECISAEAVNVDAARRRLICLRPLGEAIEVPYDHLIVAAGLRQSYFGHDEFAEWAPGMKTISDALTIRRRVLGAFEMAETAANPAEQRQWLTFALVGAGANGRGARWPDPRAGHQDAAGRISPGAARGRQGRAVRRRFGAAGHFRPAAIPPGRQDTA